MLIYGHALYILRIDGRIVNNMFMMYVVIVQESMNTTVS